MTVSSTWPEAGRTGRGAPAAPRRMLIVAAATGIVLLAACGRGTGSSAPAYVYWGDGASSIGRANLDGSDVNQRFITVRIGRMFGVATGSAA